MLNCKSKGKSTAGELVNLMSVDAQRLMQIITYINCLWSSPLQIGVALFFLYNTLGLSVLAGLGVMLLLVPLNMLFGSRMGALQVIVCYYFVLKKILKVHDNIDQFIALLLLFLRALSFRKWKRKNIFCKTWTFISEPGRRIELKTVHAQSKQVVEFHFSLKCPLISVLVLEKSLNFL